jgi:predicted RNase H-related nuclease YkuK (DUF458 family)
MNNEFNILQTGDIVDLVQYTRQYILNNPEVELLIGCDSQNYEMKTNYAIVVGFYRPKKGAHVIFKKFSFPIVPRHRMHERLLNEVWYSVETAEKLKKGAGIVPAWIDIDINPDPKYASNKVLSNAVGLVRGMGYKVRHKSESPVMNHAADHLVK